MVALCCPLIVFCQDITGLWKGTMFNDQSKQSLDYEIVIKKEKGKYSGYSHTWFIINEKRYYGIKKIQVRIARDGKIVLQDDELIANNYPVSPNKDIRQLNVLDLANPGDEASLDGLFVTNRTKDFAALTGQISLKRVSLFEPSDLVSYLQKNNNDVYLAFVK